MNLQFTHIRSNYLQRQVVRLASRLSTISLYYVTITWQRIFKCSFEVTEEGVLPHVTVESSHIHGQRRNQLFISVGAIFIKFHSMTSSCLFNRGTTFSQTVTYNKNVFLPADTKSIVQTHTFCTTLVNKNRQKRTFCNSVGGWITGVK